MDPKAGLREFVDNLVKLYEGNRELIAKALVEFGMEPVLREGAYYMMVRHNRESDLSAAKEFLDKGIAVAPGVSFYRPGTKDSGYIRLHFAVSKKVAQKAASLLNRG